MKIITRYMLSGFLRILGLTVLGLVVIFLVVDFLEKVDNFLEVDLPWSTVARFFLLSIPMIIFYITPVAVLVATLISLGLLARNSEVVAFKASGVSLYRLSAPIVVASLAVSVFIFLLSDRVIPHTSVRTNWIWNVEVERNRSANSQIRWNIWFRTEKGIFNFGVYDERLRTLQDINVFLFDDMFRLRERIEAAGAVWKNDRWEARGGMIKKYLPDGQIEVRSFDREVVTLPEIPEQFGQADAAPEEMSTLGLAKWIKTMETGGYDPVRYVVDFHLKFAFPFICTIMALIGIPIAFWKEKGGGIALGIGVGIGLSFVYLVFLGLSRSLGYSGLFPPAAAAWLPNAIYILLSFSLFTYVRQ